MSNELNQTIDPPFDSLKLSIDYINKINILVTWDSLGILLDEGNQNFIILFLKDDLIIATIRANLDFDSFIKLFGSINIFPIEIRILQGSLISREDLIKISSLQLRWNQCISQSMGIPTASRLSFYLKRYFNNTKTKGRGKDFTKDTINKLARISHGRCMFRGCGEPLNLDLLTGRKGNYGTNAHIVAASEQGERGLIELSAELSNNPENLLYICEKHHRLIDRVAGADFPASELSLMRKEFIDASERLLDGLSYRPIVVYSILWPVAGNFISSPCVRDISSSLALIHSRIDGLNRVLSSNEKYYRDNPEALNEQLIERVNIEAENILSQTKEYGFRAAIFAFGPTPALIGLGALLGNKNEFTPMHRSRENNSWLWPGNPTPFQEKYYNIKYPDKFNYPKDVAVCIGLTNYPPAMINTALQLRDNLGAVIIDLVALPGCMGNGAIPTPQVGNKFRDELRKLFLDLKAYYKVERIHLLPCVGNAVSVLIGQAMDLHQPDILVYDFLDTNSMSPRFTVVTEKHKNKLVKCE